MKQTKKWILGGLLAVMLTATASADLRKGLDAYNSGDYAIALAILTPLADAGDVDAQFNLAKMYELGNGVVQNNKKAVKWYRRAAEANYIPAQYKLGLMYETGDGVAQNRYNNQEAMKWYSLAAKAGDADAQYRLGLMYHFGKEGLLLPSVSRTSNGHEKAVEWWHRAAESEHFLAQLALGKAYHKGEGTERDYAEAGKWYRIVATNSLEAQNGLGEIYYEGGKGVLQDYTEAEKWWRLAAEAGNSESQYRLGQMYRDVRDDSQNKLLAYMWFNLAGAQKHTYATKERDEIANQMAYDQIIKAQAMAEKCRAQNYKNCDKLALQN